MNKPPLKTKKIGLSRRGYRRCKQGYYSCKNPKKYVGDINAVIYRSGLELIAFRFLDLNQNVHRWGAEIITVPYFDKASMKQRTYYLDLYVEFVNKNNKLSKSIIEIKPYNQTKPPAKRGKNFDKRNSDYITNMSKWQAATQFAQKNGMEFHILTEKHLR